MPATSLTPTISTEIARLGHADIMVGIPSFKNAATIGYVVRASQAGLVQYFPDLRPVLVNSDAGSPDGTARVVVETEPPDYVEQILLVRQPIGGDFGVSGDLVRHYLELDDWTDDISRFGIDIWMTTSALTGGFAVCQARLGAKVHDPKDPGADLGPMFRQVVGTILRLAATHPSHWLSIRGSHDIPAYGFERVIDPPPLEVNPV